MLRGWWEVCVGVSSVLVVVSSDCFCITGLCLFFLPNCFCLHLWVFLVLHLLFPPCSAGRGGEWAAVWCFSAGPDQRTTHQYEPRLVLALTARLLPSSPSSPCIYWSTHLTGEFGVYVFIVLYYLHQGLGPHLLPAPASANPDKHVIALLPSTCLSLHLFTVFLVFPPNHPSESHALLGQVLGHRTCSSWGTWFPPSYAIILLLPRAEH